MKAKLTGLVVLLLVILLAGAYSVLSKGTETTEITGYGGGEKIGLLEDEEVIQQQPDQLTLRTGELGDGADEEQQAAL